jgi:hypothetical protein
LASGLHDGYRFVPMYVPHDGNLHSLLNWALIYM